MLEPIKVEPCMVGSYPCLHILYNGESILR
jgi:hypothetical protein